uniref:Uncharacterized protein n=1 Tax=Glossina austeni TaxID=7395 RepID=A0A1A9URD1_GLOAU
MRVTYCIMVFIPNDIFSKLLYRYPDLWALDRRHVCWEIAGRELADRLSYKLNQRVTTDDVKHKVLLIKASLKKLNKTQRTARTTLCAYHKYAHKLGLKHAANRLIKQLISHGGIKIGREKITPQVEVMDKADRLIEEVIDERVQTPQVEVVGECASSQLKDINISQKYFDDDNDDVFTKVVDDEVTITVVLAATVIIFGVVAVAVATDIYDKHFDLDIVKCKEKPFSELCRANLLSLG